MKNQGIVYYVCCLHKSEVKGKYLEYQRSIADQILDYDFIKRFGVHFDREKVKIGKYGKPYWQGNERIYFNVSNTEGLVVCALFDCEIGVDAEKIRKIRMPVVRRCCSLQELSYILEKKGGRNIQEDFPGKGVEDSESISSFQEEKRELKEREAERFFQIWTLKESYIKMTGEGMHFPIREVEFEIKEIKSGLNISCNYPAFFAQKEIKEHWMTLCAQEETEIFWEEMRLERLACE